MRVVLILSMLLAMVGTALAGPVEDARAANAARDRGDHATALRLYRRAADQGNLEAQLSLGFIYHKGLGVPYDDTESAKWWRRAADQGDAAAQRNIGMAYRFGQGVPQNNVLALMWLNLAVAHGYKSAAKDREEFAPDVTAAEVAEAQKLTDEWKPTR